MEEGRRDAKERKRSIKKKNDIKFFLANVFISSIQSNDHINPITS